MLIKITIKLDYLLSIIIPYNISLFWNTLIRSHESLYLLNNMTLYFNCFYYLDYI